MNIIFRVRKKTTNYIHINIVQILRNVAIFMREVFYFKSFDEMFSASK